MLLFPFEAAATTTIRVRPVWWPTGEQKLAKRFPYPLERQPGPAALDSVGTTVFATAPAAGRVIAIDAVSERPLGAIDVGGYLADLVADRDQGRVYVADALGDRVVTIDANTRVVLGAINVPGTPWSLALNEGVLYVACRDSKRLWGFDTGTGKTLCEIALPTQPTSLEAVGNPATRLVVRFQQQAFDGLTLDPAVEDQTQFVSAESAGKVYASAESAGKVYAADGGRNRVLVMDAKTQNVESEISVPGQPSSVAVVGEVTLQRTAATEQDGPWLPRTVSRLYVICRESNDLAVVDLKTNQIVKRVPLAGEARGVKFVAMPDPCWWPLMADDRIPFALQPRVAVEYRPMMLDLATQRLLPAPVETPEAAPASRQVMTCWWGWTISVGWTSARWPIHSAFRILR
ncbi:MAG: YncE family protein [Armatimonadota bacterium]